jgi:hypothetical protein
LNKVYCFVFPKGSGVVPVTAFKHMCEMLPASEHSPAFVFPKGSGVVPVTAFKHMCEMLNTNAGECSEAGNISHMCLKAVTGQSGELGIETKGI